MLAGQHSNGPPEQRKADRRGQAREQPALRPAAPVTIAPERTSVAAANSSATAATAAVPPTSASHHPGSTAEKSST